MKESQAISRSKYLKRSSNYDKHPFVKVTDSSDDCKKGWPEIKETISDFISTKTGKQIVIAVEVYPGVLYGEVLTAAP
jgi:hypothetical protein